MVKKFSKILSKNRLLELKISDALTNLEEYTRSLTENLDFSCFDILSVTRQDSDSPYTRMFAHPKPDTGSREASSNSEQIVTGSNRKHKLN